MAQSVEVESLRALSEEDQADRVAEPGQTTYDPALGTDRDIVVCRISGAFFFGAAANVAAALDRIGPQLKAYVLEFSAVPVIDSTAAAAVEGFVRKAESRKAAVYVAGARPPIRRILLQHGVRPPQVRFRAGFADALTAARHGLENSDAPRAASCSRRCRETQ
jgi:sulfate permease, SulP family